MRIARVIYDVTIAKKLNDSYMNTKRLHYWTYITSKNN